MSSLAKFRLRDLFILCALVLMGVLALRTYVPHPAAYRWKIGNEWHDFSGTWTATGTRNTFRLDGDHSASIATYSGSLLLAGPEKPGIGFRSEAVVFNDSRSGMLGRAVWTDEHGDQVFSELRGSGNAAQNKILGTFLGGTGRYAGANGTYEFSWKFMIENEDGNVQGQSLGLAGRVRVGSQQAAAAGGPRS